MVKKGEVTGVETEGRSNASILSTVLVRWVSNKRGPLVLFTFYFWDFFGIET